MTNDAHGKQPTVAEEMAKFSGFSVTDGVTSKGEATAEEKAVIAANGRTHAQNIDAEGKSQRADELGGKEKSPAAAAKTAELTDDEKTAAIAAAATKAGVEPDDLDDEAREAAEAAALTKKADDAKSAARKQSAKARIADITRARRTAERSSAAKDTEIADLKTRLAALERGDKPAQLTQDDRPGRKELPGKPDPDDEKKYQYGELDAKYIADLTRWTVLDAQAEAREAEKSGATSEAEAEAIAAFEEKVTAFDEAGLSEFEDFDTVVIETRGLDKTDPAYWPLSPTMGELILESDHGPAIAYALASDPAEARRLIKLTPARQAVWFGLKEAELSAGSGARTENEDDLPPAAAGAREKTPAKVQESKAPAPLPSNKKLNGHGGNRVPNSATTDFAAFEAQHNASQRRN